MIKKQRPWGLWILMFASFFVASLWMIVPLGNVLQWVRPDGVLLVLIYWLTRTPNQVHLSGVFVLGLFNDLLHQSLFGMHALIFIVIAYIILKMGQRFWLMSIVQRWVTILLMSLLSSALSFWLLSLVHPYDGGLLLLLPAIVTVLFWQPVRWLMDRLILLVQPEVMHQRL